MSLSVGSTVLTVMCLSVGSTMLIVICLSVGSTVLTVMSGCDMDLLAVGNCPQMRCNVNQTVR